MDSWESPAQNQENAKAGEKSTSSRRCGEMRARHLRPTRRDTASSGQDEHGASLHRPARSKEFACSRRESHSKRSSLLEENQDAPELQRVSWQRPGHWRRALDMPKPEKGLPERIGKRPRRKKCRVQLEPGHKRRMRNIVSGQSEKCECGKFNPDMAGDESRQPAKREREAC